MSDALDPKEPADDLRDDLRFAPPIGEDSTDDSPEPDTAESAAADVDMMPDAPALADEEVATEAPAAIEDDAPAIADAGDEERPSSVVSSLDDEDLAAEMDALAAEMADLGNLNPFAADGQTLERDWLPNPRPPLDIDAALASITTLEEVVAQEEAAEQAEAESQAARRQRIIERERHVDALAADPFPQPRPLAARRGSAVSIITGAGLLLAGGGLTYLNTSGSLPGVGVVGLVAVGAICVLLLWMASARWVQGGLFAVLAAGLTIGGGVLANGLPGALPQNWPMMLVGPALALILTGLLARPRNLRAIWPGFALVVAALTGLAVTKGYVRADILDAMRLVWPLVALAVVVLLLLPLFGRRTTN